MAGLALKPSAQLLPQCCVAGLPGLLGRGHLPSLHLSLARSSKVFCAGGKEADVKLESSVLVAW